VRRLKSHGAFRSGSNYLKALLELNYEVEVVNGHGGFKHAPIPALFDGRNQWQPPPDPVIGSVKNPWSWLRSMWRYVNGRGAQHVECSRPWAAFLRSSVTVTHGGHPGFPRYRFASPMDYWNSMAANLASFDRGLVVRYEDALLDPVDTCRSIAERYDLPSRPHDFTRVAARTSNMADRPRRGLRDYVTGEAFDARYYLEERYLAEFSWRDRRLVRTALDDLLLRRFDY
jgi:hypothetical protein